MSDSNPYAAFGVTNAVLSGENIEEHRQAMLSQDVAVRDGDDEVILKRPEPEAHEDAGVTVKDLVEDPYGDTDGRIEITIPTEGENTEATEGDQEEEGDEVTDGEPDASEEGVGEALGDAPDELVKASAQIKEYADGFASMRAQAVSNGLTEEAAAKIEQEYTENSELSQESLDALAKAGFAPAFVKSFIQGQEAMATAYVGQIVQYAGGQEKFDILVKHLNANAPGTVEVLEDAIQRQDLAAIRSTINLAKASHAAKFGKAPARTITKAAPASKVTTETPKVEGFKSQEEMVKAMSDRRYGTDAAYRNSVRAKVAASNW